MERFKTRWVTGKVAAQQLGFSTYHLDKLRKDGTLKRGTHYRDISRKMAMRPSYRYNLSRIEKDFS